MGSRMKMSELTLMCDRLAATRSGARSRSAPLRVAAKRFLALVVAACLAATVQAQTAPTIERIRIGLPIGGSGQDDGTTRNGTWAPVAVTLRGSKEGNPRGVYRLRVETTDLQDIAYRATVAVPALAAEGLRTVTGYIVPGGDGATFRVTVETIEGHAIRSQSLPSRESTRAPVAGADDILFFGAGAGLSQLRRAADKLDRPDGKELPDTEAGRRLVAHTTDVPLLPDRWIGYDAADVVVLMTGNRDFVLQLLQDDEAPRRAALVEWVRRGGQLVVSVGRNQQDVAKLLAKMPIMDCKITGGELNQKLPVVSRGWSKREHHLPILQQVELTTLELGDRVDVLVREERKPVIVQASCGLGRVMLVAFDLDGPNFTAWDGQEKFWTRIQTEIAPYLSNRGVKPRNQGNIAPQPGVPGGQAFGDNGEKVSMQARLKRGIDSFEEIPPISFGWVALFILFYIALVGPLDYFILKKLFKRLELTWITFPISVIVVSVAVYFAAYGLKGEELRINKIDIVEIDLTDTKQVYGSTLFSLFSPRVAAYTVGLEPASDTWTAPVPAEAPGPVITLLEAGDSTTRAGSQALFRRPYEYAEEETGLRRVPIPVWSTRSFKASCRAPLKAKTPAIGITDDVGPIRKSRSGNGLAGRITNNLDVKLFGVALFYESRWYDLGSLEPGERKQIETLFAENAQGQNKEIGKWFTDLTLAPGLPLSPSGRLIDSGFNASPSGVYHLVKPMLFFLASGQSSQTNAGLRRFDQTWRLRELLQVPTPDQPRYRDEVILVARTPMLSDFAESATVHPASPSHLWVGDLPGGERTRPKTPGIMTQETFLRVYIPVAR